MAEGWARELLGEAIDAYSAGVEAHGLNPRAVRVMAEAGVDIRGQRSQRVDEYLDLAPDLVVTVCDRAAERCPVLPGARRSMHRSFPDPARADGTEDEVLAVFRVVRDEIRAFVESLPAVLAAAREGAMSPEKWDRTSAEEIDQYGVFRIRRYLARSPRTGKNREVSVVDTADWVNVIGVTPDDRIVLVRQYRHGTDRVSLEIPGGIVDAGESPADAAVRELREETGYAGSPPSHLGTVEPNPAILSNRCHTYVIRDCRPAGEQRLDPGEDIEVTTLPRSEVAAAVADGRIAHALVICAFWWLERAG
jgi:thioredoxin type arsenate reductase